MTFTHLGEQWLDSWIAENAFVTWLEHPHPWEPEKELIRKLSLPLNIQGNAAHPFYPVLKRLRAEAIATARETPIASESNQQRRMPLAGVPPQ
ncbi:hypothetical protein M1105_09460 [Limibaculum sp. FT325]|nr:hypothetical protein [Limibaculum sediminis]MCL5777213.1 hypothetical protein [Limibaculum sediminis]